MIGIEALEKVVYAEENPHLKVVHPEPLEFLSDRSFADGLENYKCYLAMKEECPEVSLAKRGIEQYRPR